MHPTAATDAAQLLGSDFVQRFASPPASHRPQIFMVWNGTVTRSYITRALEEFRDAGMGGVFIHPRPGMITEYLSSEWFSLWRFAADEAARLGLECHIYDENSYPAGFGGGHVPATNPLTATQALQPRFHHAAPVPAHADLLAAFRVGSASDGSPTLEPVDRGDLDKAVAESPVLTLSLVRESGGLWQGGFPYVDLTLPETTRTFLSVTHDAYACHAPEHLGTTCKYAFSDEPMLRPRSGWVLSAFLLAEFHREHGYDLADRLADLMLPTDAARAVRFDYQMTVQRLFETHFARPIAEWCARHQLAFTGHYMEHEWPSPQSHPSAMSLLRYMQVPGNDLLGFQFDPNRSPDFNAIWELNLTELRSVAAQTGAARTLCETCGGGGYGFTLRDIKPCEDFALACGVNLVNPHLSHQTLAGARRYDWPQTVSPHSPWFDAYRNHADHVARVQTAMLSGHPASRVLVLMPTTTAWLHFVPPAARLPGYVDELPRLRQSQTSLVRALASHLIDFDLGDELMLRDLARVDLGQLRVGHAAYDLVIVPEGMDNVLPSTLELLSRLPPGRVLTLRDNPAFVAGRRNPSAHFGPAARRVDRSSLIPEIRRVCPPTLRVTSNPAGQLPDTVLHLARQLPLHPDAARRTESDGKTGQTAEGGGGAVHFFANPYPTHARFRLQVHANSLLHLDTSSGHIHPIANADSDGWATLDVDLPPRGHLLLAAVPGHAPAPVRPSPPTSRRVPLSAPRVHRTEPNLLVLDYCDLSTAAGSRFTSIPCIRADQLIWKDHGQPQNPWRWAVQYRRTYLELAFPQPSGFELTYRFHIDPDVPLASLRVAVERPHLYDIRLNDTPLDLANGDVWFDEELRSAPAAHAARPGENRLTLRAPAMHPLCEVTPPYLLGDFALRPAEHGFHLTPPTDLTLGDLARQGLPFAHRGVHIDLPFRLTMPAGNLRITVGDWAGSVLGVSVLGQTPTGWIATSPGQLVLPGPFPPGQHTLRLDLRGHLQNLLGPWHKKGLPIPWTWDAAPSPQPAGDNYLLLPWGLHGAVSVDAEN